MRCLSSPPVAAMHSHSMLRPDLSRCANFVVNDSFQAKAESTRDGGAGDVRVVTTDMDFFDTGHRKCRSRQRPSSSRRDSSPEASFSHPVSDLDTARLESRMQACSPDELLHRLVPDRVAEVFVSGKLRHRLQDEAGQSRFEGSIEAQDNQGRRCSRLVVAASSNAGTSLPWNLRSTTGGASISVGGELATPPDHARAPPAVPNLCCAACLVMPRTNPIAAQECPCRRATAT